MLDIMRKHTRAWLIKIILGAIIIVFIFWGIGSIRARRADTAAEVNGHIITRANYHAAYSNALKNYQQIYGDTFSEDLLKKLNLEKVVLDTLIRDILVQEGAADLGIRVSDEDIKEYIRNMPVFNKDGHFSEERYRGVLENARLTPTAFEEGLRNELLWATVSETLGRFAKVSDDELWSAFQHANRQINLNYVSFAAADFKEKVKADTRLMQDYFAGHPEDYRVAAKVRVRFAGFLFRDYADKVKVSVEEIKNYYKSNMEEFREPERRRLSHVFFALKPGLTSMEVAKVQAKAEEVLKKAKAGENFAGLARQFSEDKSALNGGDVGYLSRGTVDPSFEEAVFSLQKGDISSVLRSRAGLHIVKVTDIIPSTVKPLSAVESGIKKTLTEKKIQEVTRAEAAKGYEDIIRLGGLERYAEARGLPLTETDFFSEQDEIKEVGRAASFNRAALALKKGELSSLIRLPWGYFVCEVVERRDSFIPKFEDVEAKVKADLVNDQARHLAESEAHKFMSDLKGGKPFSDLTGKYGLSARQTGHIRPMALSGTDFPFAGSAQELSVLTPAHSYIQQPIRAGDVFYIVSLADTKEAPKDLYDTQKDTIKKALLRMQEGAIVEGWLDGLGGKAKIAYSKEFEKYR